MEKSVDLAISIGALIFVKPNKNEMVVHWTVLNKKVSKTVLYLYNSLMNILY